MKDNQVRELLEQENGNKKIITNFQLKETINYETGEITEEEIQKTLGVKKEPDFVKIYLNTLCVFKGLSQSVTPVLFEFCKYMTWAENGQILRVDKFIKEEVSNATNLKIDRINKILKSIVDSGIFIKIEGYRGIYKVNPYFIAKGDWNNIKSLRGEFEFTNGEFKIIAEEREETD